MFLVQPQGTSPRKRAAPCHHARIHRGCLIAKATHAGNRLRLNPAALTTSPFSHVSWQQRLSPLSSIPAIKRITDEDSVTVFAKLYLPSSYAFAPRHFTT